MSLQQLPSDYCAIASIEGGALNVSFDFSYFDRNKAYLDFYSDEFQKKYNAYKSGSEKKWQELDALGAFAIKCNADILGYAVPPFVGVLREIYTLEDYKQLKLTKTELENYAMLVMKLGLNADGEWTLDFDKAKDFWRNLDAVLPEEIGSVLTPMPIEKISFERPAGAGSDGVAEAENRLFSEAGVSSLLFNNAKASSSALALSIKADQSITFGIVRGIEAAVNRFLQSKPYGKGFRVSFLDCSPYNRKEISESYLKACQYGLPLVSHFCAAQGVSQAEMDALNFLENDILHLRERFTPLQSSATQTGNAGAPEKDAGELTEAGEASREQN
jgi:hypothetical protein